MKTSPFLAVLLALIASLKPSALAAPGDPDLTFGTNGSVAGNYSSIAVRADGKIVAVGGSTVYRFLSNGMPDTAFGGTGSVTSPLAMAAGGRTVAVQTNGKIVVVGSILNDLAVGRFNADGTVDTTFGTDGSGNVSTNLKMGTFRIGMQIYEVPSSDTGVSVAVLTDNSIVAAGTAAYRNSDFNPVDLGVVHYDADGRNGFPATVPMSNGTSPWGSSPGAGGAATAVVATPDNNFVTAGWGMLYPGFAVGLGLPSGGGGSMLPYPVHHQCNDVAVGTDGRIYAVGTLATPVFPVPPGQPYPTYEYKFHLLGLGVTGPDGGGQSLAVQDDGRVIVSASGGLRRYLTDGTVDSAFRAPPDSGGSSLVIQSDGKLLTAGGPLRRYETSGGSAKLVVEQPEGTTLPRGASVDFGSSGVGIEVTRTFTVRNTAASPLIFYGITIDGPSASQFTAGTPPFSVAAMGEAAFSVTWRPSAAAPATAVMHIASSDVDGINYDIALTGTGTPVGPEIVVEQPAGADLADGAATLSFEPGAQLPFTLRSIGTTPLTGLSITRDGANPADFVVITPPPATLAAGTAATFSINFTPTGTGQRTASLHVLSNDADESSFDITLTGYQPTPFEIWRQTWFGSLENSGPGADLGDPDGDGIANILEYAMLTRPDQMNVPAGQIVKNGNTLEYTFTQPGAADAELTYALEWTESPATGPWSKIGTTMTVLSDDGIQQRVKFGVVAGSAGKRFVRLRVTRR